MPKYFPYKICGYYLYFTAHCVLECMHAHASDEELTETSYAALRDFARGSDLLLCDGQYTAEELPRCTGWGHSSMADMARLGAEAGVGQTLLLHYAPGRTDDELDRLAKELQHSYPACRLAREGEEIKL